MQLANLLTLAVLFVAAVQSTPIASKGKAKTNSATAPRPPSSRTTTPNAAPPKPLGPTKPGGGGAAAQQQGRVPTTNTTSNAAVSNTSPKPPTVSPGKKTQPPPPQQPGQGGAAKPEEGTQPPPPPSAKCPAAPPKQTTRRRRRGLPLWGTLWSEDQFNALPQHTVDDTISLYTRPGTPSREKPLDRLIPSPQTSSHRRHQSVLVRYGSEPFQLAAKDLPSGGHVVVVVATRRDVWYAAFSEKGLFDLPTLGRFETEMGKLLEQGDGTPNFVPLPETHSRADDDDVLVRAVLPDSPPPPPPGTGRGGRGPERQQADWEKKVAAMMDMIVHRSAAVAHVDHRFRRGNAPPPPSSSSCEMRSARGRFLFDYNPRSTSPSPSSGNKEEVRAVMVAEYEMFYDERWPSVLL